MRLCAVNIVIITFLTFNCGAKIMRNNALMSKMMSNFQKDTLSIEPEMENKQTPENVVLLMQNVLCKNFPTIPCEMITNDKTLNKLIERSILQLNYKKMAIDRTTEPPDLTFYVNENRDELPEYLHDAKVVTAPRTKHKKTKTLKEMERKPREYSKGVNRKQTKRTSVYSGRKKLRKLYPHKVKYKDKNRNAKDFDYSEEKLSMSVEPAEAAEGKRQHYSYRTEPESSVWRIDYTKHGEPSLNVVAYDERLRGQTGPKLAVDEIVEQTARKDVLHPDLYIKKNFVKKTIRDLHSDGID